MKRLSALCHSCHGQFSGRDRPVRRTKTIFRRDECRFRRSPIDDRIDADPQAAPHADPDRPADKELTSMRYMMFIKHAQDYQNADVPASLYEEMGKFIEETTKSGNFVGGAGLQPSSAGLV
jgi:hypothetical protein